MGVSRRLQFLPHRPSPQDCSSMLWGSMIREDPLSKEATLGLQNEGLCTRCERILGQRSLGGGSSRCKGLEAESLIRGGEPRCPALLGQSDRDGKWTKSCNLRKVSGCSVLILIIKVEVTHKS